MASFISPDPVTTSGAAFFTSHESTSRASSITPMSLLRDGAFTTSSSAANVDINFAAAMVATGVILGAVLLVVFAVCCCYKYILRPMRWLGQSLGA